MNVHFSNNSDEWSTPVDLFNKLNNIYNFTLDPSANSENAKCSKFYTQKDDGLKQDWDQSIYFCNPPYSKLKDWLKKGSDYTGVFLIPARTDTKAWHEYVFSKATAIVFIKGRLKFGDSSNSAPFPSALVIYGDLPVLAELQELGHVVNLKKSLNSLHRQTTEQNLSTNRPVNINVLSNNATCPEDETLLTVIEQLKKQGW